MKVLALDISTKTGWAFLDLSKEKVSLIDNGTLFQDESTSRDGSLEYPEDYIEWAKACSRKIIGLIEKFKPEHLVIEETSKGSKNNFSQKILEFIHYIVGKYIVKNNIGRTYYMTEQWRRICSCVMSKEEKKQNLEVRKQRKKKIKVAKNKEGKRIGLITKKHVNVRRANEVFELNLILKDEDMADALLLGYAYYLKNVK